MSDDRFLIVAVIDCCCRGGFVGFAEHEGHHPWNVGLRDFCFEQFEHGIDAHLLMLIFCEIFLGLDEQGLNVCALMRRF